MRMVDTESGPARAAAGRPRAKLAGVVLGFCLALLLPQLAQAQIGNAPFSLSVGGGGFGMSNAYREAILRKQFFNETPDHMLRSRGGEFLLQVDRYDGQAFARTNEVTFLLPATRRGELAAIGSGYSLSVPPSWYGGGAPGVWLTMVEVQEPGLPWTALSPAGGGGTPINAWIAQLENFPLP